ncbi:helix-turn-helix domain-containing protein [Streptomyces sp. WM6378]|uniref:helix-turn-helix domain-containing protein n=1 Tax=Streptomyces sp. WM6378 TaxID=1415557 RepID=UPI000AAC15B6|nr:helix-turn-helix domain-containing protein [Streptomyces sp. WM6378]
MNRGSDKRVDGEAPRGLDGIATMEGLAATLRHLRRRAARQQGDSQLTYRELAARTGWAHGVIGDYFAGKTLPPTDRFDDLIRILGATGAELGALATARDRVEEGRRYADRAVPRGSAGQRTEAPVPRELPPCIPHLCGRTGELDRLDALRPQPQPGPCAIVGLDGPVGVGKSALAVHAAHLLAGRFPDGQLYADLMGTARGRRPLPPAEVLARFLRALGDTGAVPDNEEEAGARYRALAADRRLLVVLDNAHDAAQVRPLLPAAPGCGVLVTSRRVLATVNGAVHLHVKVLPEHEALALLGALAGEDRLREDRPAAEAIVRSCGCLPLALRIASARLTARPSWPLRALADRLADPRHRLDELEYDDLRLRDGFRKGYESLLHSGNSMDRAAATALPLLTTHEGAGLTLREAARALGRTESAAEPVLERLVDTQLLESPAPGCYSFHILLRLFALEYAWRLEDPTAAVGLRAGASPENREGP